MTSLGVLLSLFLPSHPGQLGHNLLHKDVHEPRVEELAALREELLDGLIDRPGGFVRPFVREGVKDVAHGDDAALDRDCVATQPVRISPSVPTLVVGFRYNPRHAQNFRIGITYEACPDPRMFSDYLEFFGCQLARL